MTGIDHSIQPREALQRWAAAEAGGDVAALEALLAEDFAGIGPRGFVLDKQQWLARYRAADLVNQTFTVNQTTVRIYGATAIAVAVQTQQAAYQGHPVDGSFRLGAVLVGRDDAWSIVQLQLSNMSSQ